MKKRLEKAVFMYTEQDEQGNIHNRSLKGVYKCEHIVDDITGEVYLVVKAKERKEKVKGRWYEVRHTYKFKATEPFDLEEIELIQHIMYKYRLCDRRGKYVLCQVKAQKCRKVA